MDPPLTREVGEGRLPAPPARLGQNSLPPRERGEVTDEAHGPEALHHVLSLTPPGLGKNRDIGAESENGVE
jgi:hypothetical protein